ncbi:MAG: transcriptional repressor [Chloroflexi bacterium]|nr:transcriptional repressor [Chloroflexota bacterium]
MEIISSEEGKRKALRGKRVTAQRTLLLELIRQWEGHLDADELYRQAREKEPRISLSTVYRALKLFKDLGLVEERHFDEEHHHYEAKASAEHYHLVCLSCGKVIEFKSPLIPQMKEAASRDQGFDILSAEITLAGYCPRCRLRQVQRAPA